MPQLNMEDGDTIDAQLEQVSSRICFPLSSMMLIVFGYSWAAAKMNSHLHRHSPSLVSPAVPRLVVVIVLLPSAVYSLHL